MNLEPLQTLSLSLPHAPGACTCTYISESKCVLCVCVWGGGGGGGGGCKCRCGCLTFRMLPLWLSSGGNVKGISSSEAPSDWDISNSLWSNVNVSNYLDIFTTHRPVL